MCNPAYAGLTRMVLVSSIFVRIHHVNATMVFLIQFLKRFCMKSTALVSKFSCVVFCKGTQTVNVQCCVKFKTPRTQMNINSSDSEIPLD